MSFRACIDPTSLLSCTPDRCSHRTTAACSDGNWRFWQLVAQVCELPLGPVRDQAGLMVLTEGWEGRSLPRLLGAAAARLT